MVQQAATPKMGAGIRRENWRPFCRPCAGFSLLCTVSMDERGSHHDGQRHKKRCTHGLEIHYNMARHEHTPRGGG